MSDKSAFPRQGEVHVTTENVIHEKMDFKKISAVLKIWCKFQEAKGNRTLHYDKRYKKNMRKRYAKEGNIFKNCGYFLLI